MGYKLGIPMPNSEIIVQDAGNLDGILLPTSKNRNTRKKHVSIRIWKTGDVGVS